MEKALHHIMNNFRLVQDNGSSQDLFEQVATIFLTSANITLDDILSMLQGNFSGLNEASLTDMMKEAVKLMTDLKIFGDTPMVYQALEHFLASNDTSMIVQKVAEMSSWLASTQASVLDLMTQVLPKMYDILRCFLSVLTQMGVNMPANMDLFEDLAGNITRMLRQLVSTSGLLPPMDQHQGTFQLDMTGIMRTMKIQRRREAPLMPPREPIDDFIDLFHINYPAMFRLQHCND